MSRKKIIFFIIFISVSAFVVLECLTKDATFSYKTNFAKIAALYEPIKENENIHVIVSYPLDLASGFPRGYQLLAQMVHQKTLVNGLDPFSTAATEFYPQIEDISDPKTVDELARLGVDTIVVYDQLLDDAPIVTDRLLRDGRLVYVGHYSVEPDPNPYVALNDVTKSIFVFQIKKVASNYSDRPAVSSDAEKTTFTEGDGYKIIVSLSHIRPGNHLYFSQTYSPDWKIYAGRENDPTGLSYLWKQPVFDRTHEINGASGNRWAIGAEEIKKYLANGQMTENPDGSLDMDLTIFFRPRALFVLEWGTAFATILFCLGYIGWDRSKRRRAERIKN